MSIIDWYTGKNVLISGGTGFMGKVLVEKILRSIPNIGKIYILCRSKRGVTPAQRVADFSKIPLFTKLLKENPNSLNKLIVVEGDITEDGLGIKEEIRNELIENINIVFHFAASLKLEARLKESVMFNLKGTLSMLKLATDIKHLDVSSFI
ncbi:hypothetical protein O3M35_012133 [Rhynocoris fuscipes]|uniref:Fatty acyl-CoA reductase n=1 Tax=Rhynocoris fuscipes TaxID=488301 RepID=A0AAW1CV81_9HEMI